MKIRRKKTREIPAERVFHFLGHSLELLRNSLALFKRSDKFSKFVIKFFSTFNSQSNGKSSQIESGNHIVKFRIHLNWDDRFGGSNPVGHALKKEKTRENKI